MGEKTCTRCDRNLPLTDFPRRESAQDGRNTICLDCYTMRRYGRARRPKNYRSEGGHNFKTCTRCGVEREATTEHFYPNKRAALGLATRCKACASQDVMESRKKHDPTFEKIRVWNRANREKVNAYAKKSRDTRTDERKEQYREWLVVYERNRRECGKYRMLQSVRAQVNMIVRGKFDGKGLLRRLGYSRDELLTHIERQFTRGMRWENYGRNGQGRVWEIDHIVPCASFDLTNEEEFCACWALTNLRPMWAVKNRSKGKRVETLI